MSRSHRDAGTSGPIQCFMFYTLVYVYSHRTSVCEELFCNCAHAKHNLSAIPLMHFCPHPDISSKRGKKLIQWQRTHLNFFYVASQRKISERLGATDSVKRYKSCIRVSTHLSALRFCYISWKACEIYTNCCDRLAHCSSKGKCHVINCQVLDRWMLNCDF